MNQIQELLEILKETPQMALWGLGLFFLFTLLKLASWIFALKVVFQQAIKRYFNHKDKLIDLKTIEINQNRASDILKYFDKERITSDSKQGIISLLDAVKKTSYIHQSDIDRAVKLLKESKNVS